MKPFTKVDKELTKESLFSRAKYCCSDIIDSTSVWIGLQNIITGQKLINKHVKQIHDYPLWGFFIEWIQCMPGDLHLFYLKKSINMMKQKSYTCIFFRVPRISTKQNASNWSRGKFQDAIDFNFN